MGEQEKEIIERNTYQELLEVYSEKINYPQYGEWCVNFILEKIKEAEIKGSIDFMISVFDPQDAYYAECFEYNIENILRRINKDRYYNNSLYRMLENAFDEKYFDVYYSMNAELLKTEPDVLADLSNNGETTMFELFDDALEEIGIETLRKVIFEKMNRQKEKIHSR